MKIKYLFLISFFSYFFGCTPQPVVQEVSPEPSVRILLKEISQKDSILFNGIYSLKSEEATYELGSKNNKLYIVPIRNGMQLYNNTRNLLYRNHFPITLLPASDNSFFQIDGNKYNGTIIFDAADEESLFLINLLPLEEYLKGVVPSEIPSAEFANFEAVKAQAICARTYSINKITERDDSKFDMFRDTRDQVYKGLAVHEKYANRAVDETKSIILKYNDQPALVYYHSTCGGQLEPVESSFSDTSVSYLPMQKDAVSEDYSCILSPRFRWKEVRNFNQIDTAFQFHYNHGFISDSLKFNSNKDTVQLSFICQIEQRTSGGRIQHMTVTYNDTTISLSGLAIRFFWGWPPGRMLPSGLFYIQQQNDSTIVLNGGGYGHGVGMCQWGAIGMAKKGLRYYHILNKYFPGTVLGQGY